MRHRRVLVALLFGSVSCTAIANAGPPAGLELEGCALGSSSGLSAAQAAALVEQCLDYGTPIGRGRAVEPTMRQRSAKTPSAQPPMRSGSRPFTRASAGFATAVVAIECPNDFGKPCFDGETSIQDAIDSLVAAHPNETRTVLISPGTYRQRFSTSHGWNGETHIVGVGPSRLLSTGPVRIESHRDGISNAQWTFAGRGSVANVSFFFDADPEDVGIRITGILLLELYFENISLTGGLPLGSRGIEIADIFGFLTFHNSSVILTCDDQPGDRAGIYVNRSQLAFTEITIHEGHYQVAGIGASSSCATFDIVASPFGDDGHGMAVEFVHLQCEGNATCFRIASNRVRLEIGPLVFRRSPSARFMHVIGSGSQSKVFIHGVTRQAGTLQSIWGDVRPNGTMTITGNGEPTMPTFPGWTYKRNDGGPGTSNYVGEGSPGPPFEWAPLITTAP